MSTGCAWGVVSSRVQAALNEVLLTQYGIHAYSCCSQESPWEVHAPRSVPEIESTITVSGSSQCVAQVTIQRRRKCSWGVVTRRETTVTS